MSKKVVFTVVLIIIGLSSLAFGAISFGMIDLPKKLDGGAKNELQAIKEEIAKKEEQAKKKEQEKKKKEEQAKKKEEEKKKAELAKKKEEEKKKAEQAKSKEKAKMARLSIPKGPMAAWLITDSDKEKGIQKSLTEKSKQVAGVWATLKAVNGVINVLQSIQVGGSAIVEASANPMEFLSPIDNVLDRISDMLLWAFAAIIFEKILLAISGYFVFLIIIPVCVIISVVTIWTSNDKSKITKVIIVSVLINLIIIFAIPISFYLSSFIEKEVLTHKLNTVLTSINTKGNTAAKMEKELTGLKRIGSAISSYLTNAKNLGNALVEDMVNYFIIFIFSCIIMPILTIFGLFLLARFLAKVILKQDK